MSLQDKLNEDYAEAWKPSAGDELIGKITNIDTRHGEYEPYRIYTIKPEDGDAKAFHAFHFVAAQQLSDLNPAIGDEIGVKYLGKKDSEKSANGYENYRIVIERPEGWQPPSLEDEAGRQDREAQEAATATAEQAERHKQDESIPFHHEDAPLDFEPRHAHSNR